ncbi:hypothetical protein LSH36_756g01029 [Paralvinella palmiformis]|uniref:Uncharacterized protein n=1 Tax=Paralvinella palmiformis TaxID=53620 RepID=A0AAD9J0R2_9ANNE|nr:hypothetical protein LSH36_756g01029 [Paralvinella palmiformis]
MINRRRQGAKHLGSNPSPAMSEGSSMIHSVSFVRFDSGWTFKQTLTEGSDGFPYGILIVVSIGVALGVFIGGLVLSLVYFYMKRKRNPYQEPPQTDSQQDYYHSSATLKKSVPPQSPGLLMTRDLCPTITYEDHEHVCPGNTPHLHDGYYSAKPTNYPVTRVYDACASSVQRSGHVYESPQVS